MEEWIKQVIFGIIGGLLGGLLCLIVLASAYNNSEVFGTVADWVSGIATLLAVIVSLYLANRRQKPSLQVKYEGIQTLLMLPSYAKKVFKWTILNYSSVPAEMTVFGAYLTPKNNFWWYKRRNNIQNAVFMPIEFVNQNVIPIEVISNGTQDVLIYIEFFYNSISSSELNDIKTIQFYCKDNFDRTYFSKKLKKTEVCANLKSFVEQNKLMETSE